MDSADRGQVRMKNVDISGVGNCGVVNNCGIPRLGRIRMWGMGIGVGEKFRRICKVHMSANCTKLDRRIYKVHMSAIRMK